jgi:hypothetical protein
MEMATKKTNRKGNALPDLMSDWSGLLTAVQEDADVLPNVEPHRQAMEQALKDVQEAKARQEMHTASKQQATQDLKAKVANGKEKAIRLRGAVRADIGPRSERLVHYRIAPLRKRRGKAKPDGETPAPGQPGQQLPPPQVAGPAAQLIGPPAAQSAAQLAATGPAHAGLALDPAAPKPAP